MRHRIVLLAALAALVMSALPAVAVEAPVSHSAASDAEAAEERAAEQEARAEAGEITDESVEAFDGTGGAEDGDGVDREALAEQLAAGDEGGLYIVQFQSPAVPAYAGGIDGLEATVAEGEQLEVDTAAVHAYRGYLAEEQSGGLATIGGELDREVTAQRAYDLAINGVAVELEPDEAAAVALLDEVAFVEPQQILQLQTDAGPEHMGADAIWDGDYSGGDDGTQGEGAVVGILDSGIWPDNPSFAEVGPVDEYEHQWDDGYLGVCDPDDPDYDPDFVCNDKLVGAWGMTDANTAFDADLHGTHVASTAVGNVVDVELGPEGNEQQLEISGVAPHAHITSYRVCDEGCPLDAIIDGVNQAIEDEVDVLNYSIGGSVPSADLWEGAENVAWLNANGSGIAVSQSAGNAGPGDATVNRASDLPWVTSVGASEHDRAIENQLVDIVADGEDQEDVVGKGFTGGLEAGTDVVYDTGNPYCYDPVDEDVASGNIVLCDRGGPDPIGRVESSENVEAAGGVGFVLMNSEAQADSVHGDEFAVPGVHVSHAAGEMLKDVVADNDEVTAGVAGYEFVEGHQFTDYSASFSSRGPNQAAQTLVPNVTAPGLDIIAAVNPDGDGDPQWGVISGTSMSSPHVAGAYGLLSAARDWSPAEAQSALQLTARPDMPKEDGTTGDPHSEGSGYAELGGAVDAGFVMDITQDDYVAANPDEGGDVRQLNYPDLVNYEHAGSFTWNRELTSTQDASVTYTVGFEGDDGLELDAPAEITVDGGETTDVEFTATTGEDVPIGETLFGRVTLTPDGDVPDAHMPVVVETAQPESNLEVDPDAVSALLEVGQTAEETVTVSNTGNVGFSWLLTGEGVGPVWDQPIDGTSGIVSDRFIDNEDDSGVFAADDFTVGGEGTTVESIFTPGFWAPTFPGQIDDAYQISWYIYPDDGGVPAGHPDDGQDLEVWSFEAAPGDDGVTIDDDDVTLDLAAADAPELELDAGQYWISVFPDIDRNTEAPNGLNDRWNWYNGTASGEPSKLVDPDGLFGAASDEWEDFSEIGVDWEGLAFTLSGSFNCTLPGDVPWLDVDPETGDLGPGEDEQVALTLDSSDMDLGIYNVNLCFGTDDPGAPVATVAVELEVTDYGSIEGAVTDAETEDPVEDAEVSVDGRDLSTTTDENGEYLLEDVPAGPQTVVAEARGYAAQEQEVEVEGDQTATADFELEGPPPLVGIFGDDEFAEENPDFAELLDTYDLPHEPFEYGDDVASFSVIIVNKAGYSDEDVFLEFIDDADEYDTGLVFLDSSSSQVSGIPELHNHLDNPAVRETGSVIGVEEFSFEVIAEHPIVEGFDSGDEITFSTDPPNSGYAWFDDYSGDDVTLIADALADGDPVGTSIAAEDRQDGARHALLSLHGASWPWGGPGAWTVDGERVFINALEWASTGSIGDPQLVDLEVEPESAELAPEETQQFTATAHYDDDTSEDVTAEAEWASDDTGVVTVDDVGLATAVAVGDADVSATFDGESGSASVRVSEDPPEDPVLESVEVQPGSADLAPEETQQFTATAHYDDDTSEDVTAEAEWVSDDTGVVTVDDVGLATAEAVGEADVTAEFGGLSDFAEVTVSEDDVPPPEDPVDLVVSPGGATVGVGGVAQFEATAVYEDDTEVTVTDEADWVSADTDVATVDDAGLVAGVAEGTAEVTATFEDLSDSSSVTVDAQVEPGPEGLERISAEPGRVEVAIAASQHRFDDGETNAVVLARADEYPDALAGTTLAAEVDAPLLLTSSDELLDNVAEEVSRVLGNDGAVYLTGGTAALDDTVEGAVDELGYQTMRLGGETRFETAGLIADELGERSQVLVTTGLDFPDALTAGAAASANDGVVLLSADDDPHDVVDDYLDGFDGEVTAVGGPATRAYPDAEAVMGATRDETAVAVAEAFFDEPVAFGVARRDDYPDALAGGAHIAAYEGPLLLTYTEDVPEETADWLTNTDATGGFVYGGTAAVSEDTFDELEALAFDDNNNDDEGQ